MDGHRADTNSVILDGRSGGKSSAGRTRRITSQVVTGLKAPAAGNRVVWDSDLTGFGARITAAGAVSFVLRYVLQGRERRYTIGKHPDLSPGAARERATVLRGRIAGGEDPMETRREARDEPTIDELCDDYMERHAKPKKRSKSIIGDESLNQALYPAKTGEPKGIVGRPARSGRTPPGPQRPALPGQSAVGPGLKDVLPGRGLEVAAG